MEKPTREEILKSGTTYIFRIISGAAGNVVSYEADWYENGLTD